MTIEDKISYASARAVLAAAMEGWNSPEAQKWREDVRQLLAERSAQKGESA